MYNHPVEQPLVASNKLINSTVSLTTVLIVGATGLFGELLAKRLSQTRNHCKIYLAARSLAPLLKTKKEIELIKLSAVEVQTQTIDISSLSSISSALTYTNPHIVVNCSGPFQYSEQNYALMRMCAGKGIHYIDLADSPEFVLGVPTDIHALAQKNNVSITTGVSSVPALSSSVFKTYKEDFSTITDIEIGIAPGNQTKRGLATVRSILSYAGRPIKQKRIDIKKNKFPPHSIWKPMSGWGNLHTYKYPKIGERYLSNCLSPDNALFDKFYPEIPEIKFSAGLELGILHLGLSFLSQLSRLTGLNLSPLAKPLLWISNWFLWAGSDEGAMHVIIYGRDHNSLTMSRKVHILAFKGSGPYIPTLASLLLIDKINNRTITPGVHTGFELFELSDFEAEVKRQPTLPIDFLKERQPLT